MNNHILIAEDDPDIIEVLRLYLESAGFTVSTATDGEMALNLVQTGQFFLALVDIMMPKMNGYELIQAIRQTSSLPIIIISAKSMDTDRILGLNLGADAYIAKPFNPLEVLAYVRAIYRRHYHLGEHGEEQQESKVLQVGELTLDTENFQLMKRGEPVLLTSTELKILTKMMRNPGRIFTKAQLYECVNGEYFESDSNTMMVHISNIRAKVEDNPGAPQYIKTVRGLGYKIEAKKDR